MAIVGEPVPVPVMTTAVPATLTVQPAQKKAKDFLIFTVILMTLFFLHGNILFGFLTLPALILSLSVCTRY